ncbi:hypothetical protein HPB48_012832 [Haemaphysalis longicornis]|uniref:Uncharacterized protein n=1 Tax=Haemaphysalis longicornis TaxID=44386 RepID=A0A9J6GMM6_HAELO|nr:hypothetical protein HPB48_012832 [Haemaphysalis longicornis]
MATSKQRWYFSAHRTFLRHFMGHQHHHRTFLVTTFVVLAALLSWQYCGTRYAGWTPAKFWRLGLLIDTPGCQLAAHDPFDHSMQKRYYKDTWRNETLCQDPDDPVKFVRYDVPELNGPLLQRRYGVSAEDVHCQYSPLTRNLTAAIPDLNAVYGAPRPVVFGEPIPDEYILLWCNAGKKKLFGQHYFLPKRRNTKPLSREQIGVVVIGLDSVSRSNSFRQLPRTRQFMKERGAFEMLGYNKVGENTMPNVIPLLTGMSGDLVRTRYRRRNFDGLPHLMAVYKEKGFPTIYHDECPNSGVFVYVGGMGFREAPSDYYPYFGSIVPPALSPCAALKYFSDVVTLNKKMFAWLWLMNMTHEDINDAGYLDLPLESTLRSLAASGIMENNALLVMADHGARYGDYRLTDLGDYEDKLPVCLLALPQRFLHQYPEAAANLEVNQRRLVTSVRFARDVAGSVDAAPFPLATNRPGLEPISKGPTGENLRRRLYPAPVLRMRR